MQVGRRRADGVLGRANSTHQKPEMGRNMKPRKGDLEGGLLSGLQRGKGTR